MKGNFEKINLNRSLAVSEILFKTLLLHIAEENFPGGKHNAEFDYIPNGIRNLPEHPEFKQRHFDYIPLYSVGRKLWVSYSFNEEKAHRLAFYEANQTEKLLIVFCNPSYVRHHRCIYPNTEIISIYEFSNLLNPELRLKYEWQTRFLQNHLNLEKQLDINKLKEEIENPKPKDYEIMKSDLMEALGVMKISPVNEYDIFHFLAAINLINAFLSRNRKKDLPKKEHKLLRDMYYFKTYLSNVLTDLIKRKTGFAQIYIQNDFTIIQIMKFQFSFHHSPKNETIISYEKSSLNKKIEWTGKRLQPIAPLLLYYSRILRELHAYKKSPLMLYYLRN